MPSPSSQRLFALSALMLCGSAAAAGRPAFESGDRPGEFQLRTPRGVVSLGGAGLTLAHAGGRAPQVRWRLEGSSLRLEPGRLASGRVHRFQGDDPSRWRRGLPRHAELGAPNALPGVDLHLTATTEGLKYELVIAPLVPLEAVQIVAEGAGAPELSGDGRSLRFAHGLEDRGLSCTQPGPGGAREVPCRFKAGGDGSYGFEAPTRDPRLPLRIDPLLEWSSFLGGSLAEANTVLAVDGAGRTYVAGTTPSTDLAIQRARDAGYAGSTSDAYVGRILADGTLDWLAYLGGSDVDSAGGIALAASGDVVVGGTTSSSDFPLVGAFDTQLTGNRDCFVTRLSADGTTIRWSSFFGPNNNSEDLRGLALTSGGDMVIAGNTFSQGLATSGAWDTAAGGNEDGFVARLRADGAGVVWASYVGGGSYDYGDALAVDAFDNVFVAGRSWDTSTGMQLVAPFDSDIGDAGTEGWVVKLTPDGTAAVFSSYLGGRGAETIDALVPDGVGGVYVGGRALANDFPLVDSMQPVNGPSDAFLVHVPSAGGALLWSTFLGGSGIDRIHALARTPDGMLFVGGSTSSADFPVPGGLDPTFGGGQDGFIARLDESGRAIRWASFLGGAGTDTLYSIVPSGAGALMLGGTTSSSDFPLVSPFDATLAGTDAFIARLTFPSCAPSCGEGAQCAGPSDCASGSCSAGVCGAAADAGVADAGAGADAGSTTGDGGAPEDGGTDAGGAAGDGGAPEDGGTDAGGAAGDGGAPEDGGSAGVDAGDGGSLAPDGGAPADAGSAPGDAGSLPGDGGVPDAGGGGGPQADGGETSGQPERPIAVALTVGCACGAADAGGMLPSLVALLAAVARRGRRSRR